MWVLIAVFGLFFLAGATIMACFIVAGRTDRTEEEAHERWIEDLKAVAAAQAAPVQLPATAERLPFEDEIEAPTQARADAQRHYEDLMTWWADQQEQQRKASQ